LGIQAGEWQAANPSLPLDLVFGVRAEKQPRDVLAPLAPFAARLRSVAIPGDTASLSAGEATEAARAAGIVDSEPAAGPAEAVRALVSNSGPRRILICGSLYLAGAILAENS
jgi:dihydrofolate synthase/folylpolyglutamate synthase